MRTIERTGGHAPGRERCSGERAAGCRTQTEPRKMDDISTPGRFAGNTVHEESDLINYYDLLMEQQERA